MKKILVCILMGAFILSLSFTAECRNMQSVHEMLSKKSVVNVYLGDFTDSSGNSNVDLENIKQILENALATRMTINFNIVDNMEEADIAIQGDVFEMFWTDTDPVDNVSGLGAMAMDAAIQENYARMQIDMSVIDAKNGKMLWQEKVKATITDNTMTESDSVIMLPERITKMFMKECFAKPKRNRGML